MIRSAMPGGDGNLTSLLTKLSSAFISDSRHGIATCAGHTETLVHILAATDELESGPFENLLEGCGQGRPQLGERLIVVRGIQAIVGNNDEFVLVEPHLRIL